MPPSRTTTVFKWISILLGIQVLVFSGIGAYQWYKDSHPFFSKSGQAQLMLHHGPFTLLRFSPTKMPPLGVILFASGDGGWEWWEEGVAHALEDGGYEVIGIDSAKYAVADYDLAILQEDFSTIAHEALIPYGFRPPPLIIGGWSMGAAQAIAAVGGPHPPRHVAGLLLVSPMSRGRYGLHTPDKIDILPIGVGTFPVDEFARTLDHVRVVQWHGSLDITDSRAWLKDVTAPHKEFDFPNSGHEFDDADQEFLRQFVKSVDWIIHPPPPDPKGGAK